MKKSILLLILAPTILLSSENIFDKMDDETAVTTGIKKLSRAEQDALLKWLKNSKKQIVQNETDKNMGFSLKESKREEIHSTIVGEFNGWRGKSTFKLANGQIWQQSESTTFYIPKRNNPDITIEPKSFGAWQLYLDGFGKGVKVKRIK